MQSNSWMDDPSVFLLVKTLLQINVVDTCLRVGDGILQVKKGRAKSCGRNGLSADATSALSGFHFGKTCRDHVTLFNHAQLWRFIVAFNYLRMHSHVH